MAFNPATDFLALWRNIAGTVTKVEMPGLDYVVAALARAGLITLSVSATAPVVSQSVTAWLQAATPSNSAEGVLRLWDPATSAYAAATPARLLYMLQAAVGQNGVSWWTSVGGPPLNTVGNNGDFAVRTDAPNGIYGPKALGAWPASPIPGTADLLSSTTLDNTFGSAEGDFIIRGPAVWQAFPIGAPNAVMASTGLLPQWGTLTALMDAVFGSTQGSILYRDVGVWNALLPGVANQVLASGGAGANPAWAPRTAEFPSGTKMLFQQTAAPVGWTKQVTITDYGLRVTSGTVGTTPGTAFSTVFAQTAVGGHTLSIPEMPSHAHSDTTGVTIQVVSSPGAGVLQPGGNVTGATGGGGSHTHSVSLSLSYVDVIIASKN
jgi:hypothetical protein